MSGGRIEKYMYILQPDCRNKHFDLVNCHEERFECYRQIFRLEEKLPELQVKGSQLIPWATIANGEWLFRRVLPRQDPDEWHAILSQPRGSCWKLFEMNCTDFLRAALTKEIRSDVLWDQFPLDNHAFTGFPPKL